VRADITGEDSVVGREAGVTVMGGGVIVCVRVRVGIGLEVKVGMAVLVTSSG
jgi:hypothetical protein